MEVIVESIVYLTISPTIACPTETWSVEQVRLRIIIILEEMLQICNALLTFFVKLPPLIRRSNVIIYGTLLILSNRFRNYLNIVSHDFTHEDN